MFTWKNLKTQKTTGAHRLQERQQGYNRITTLCSLSITLSLCTTAYNNNNSTQHTSNFALVILYIYNFWVIYICGLNGPIGNIFTGMTLDPDPSVLVPSFDLSDQALRIPSAWTGFPTSTRMIGLPLSSLLVYK